MNNKYLWRHPIRKIKNKKENRSQYILKYIFHWNPSGWNCTSEFYISLRN